MNESQSLICRLASPDKTARQLSEETGLAIPYVYTCARQYGLPLKKRKESAPRESVQPRILALADGVRTSREIAAIVGCNEKHVQNVIRVAGAPRLPRGARSGELNPSFRFGRMIDRDGYAVVAAPDDHPHAREAGIILQHRLVMEAAIGRYLTPLEVVDHIDGLHLHNDPSNLRLFATNADHLRATISGIRPDWSPEGFARLKVAPALRAGLERIDTYRLRKRRGDVRLQQILLAALKLGIDSPHLLGTHHHLEQAQIDYSSRSTIERALADLSC